MARLEVRALAVGRGGRRLLEGLSFTLAAGERVALVGPSGVGKTTALRAIALLDDPLAGELRLDGRTPAELGVPRWRRRVTLLAQRAWFFGGTVAEELARPFAYRAAERPFDADEARQRLAALGLAGAWDRPVDELSEGERQRVALVRALSVRPDVLLLDEPTSALDPDATAAAEALLGRREDLSLVLVSHREAQRARLGARPVELRARGGASGAPTPSAEGIRAAEGR